MFHAYETAAPPASGNTSWTLNFNFNGNSLATLKDAVPPESVPLSQRTPSPLEKSNVVTPVRFASVPPEITPLLACFSTFSGNAVDPKALLHAPEVESKVKFKSPKILVVLSELADELARPS